jgi:hypothetical protein
MVTSLSDPDFAPEGIDFLPTYDSGVTFHLPCGCTMHHHKGGTRLVTPCSEHSSVKQDQEAEPGDQRVRAVSV